MDRGQKKEAMDPIMMDEEQIKEIMDKNDMQQKTLPV